MADGSNTLSPASVWFVTAGETVFDVTDFVIDERMNSLFQVVVHASSPDGTVDPTTFIGKGGAFRFRHHAGDIVRAGICSEAAQVQNQPDGAVTISTYRFVIVPALLRTTLRRNNRHFQGLTVPEIVFKILDEWKIPFAYDLKEAHLKHEFRVQYDETDFAFMSRLLEEEGISYWFDHASKSGNGSTVTSVFFSDQPELGASLGSFPYRQTGTHKTFKDGENVIYGTSITQRMKFGKATIRDFDLRLSPDLNLAHTENGVGASAEELKYEDYQYVPGAFRAVGMGDAHATPVADNPLKVRTVEQHMLLRTKRAIEAARHGHTVISFQTTALEWAPGDVLEIGKGDQTHPSPQVKGKKMLVTKRLLTGTTSGIRDQRIEVVPADVPHRPARKTPKARVLGLQSAIVVGPKDQEIHTDELGRVRVQFHWDREHAYDEKSSCWIRVSQGWAGGGFGLIALPRVGHEVLVGFYDGDPDRPVVVGRVYNRRNVVPEALAAHKTKSGWRSESSGGAQSHSPRGYNELMFEDAKGQESISIRAEKSLATLVKASESRSIGGVRSTRVGEADIANVGKFSQVLVGKEVGLQMSERGKPDIVLSTGKASIRLSGDDIFVEAEGNLLINTKDGILLSSLTVVDVVGGPEVCINCDEERADKAGGAAAPVPIGPTTKPGGGPKIAAPFFPKRAAVLPPPPLGFEEINVGNAPPPPPPPIETAPAPPKAAPKPAARAPAPKAPAAPPAIVATAPVTPVDPLPKAIPTGGPEYYQARYDDFKRRHPDKEPPDYYLGYGKKYATRFMESTESKLSPEGKAWLYRTRENLQKSIEAKRAMDPVAFDQLEQDNLAFRRFAYDSHPKSYIDAGLLKLPAGDLYQITMTPDVSDLVSKDGLNQVWQVMKQTGGSDYWNMTKASAGQAGRGIANAWNSAGSAISDWWGK